MKEKIWTAYDAFNDMTFIMKSIVDRRNRTISDEVVGFYWGAPDDKATEDGIGKLKAEY